jgi:hypothetical protein
MRIRHFRKNDFAFKSLLRHLTKEGVRKSLSRSANGATSVTVILPNGIGVTAWAVCHRRDTFTKKEGVRVALEKLATAFPEAGIIVPEKIVHEKVPYSGPYSKK